MQTWITDYLDAQKRATDSIPTEAVAQGHRNTPPGVARRPADFHLRQRRQRGEFLALRDRSRQRLLRCGRPRFRVLSLTDNVSWMTAIGNDYSYDDVFTRQLTNYGRADDVLITVSVSGNSPNLVKALEWAKPQGLKTIALVGAKRGRTAELADEVIAIGDTHYGRVEDAQMHVLHLFCYAFMELPELAK